MSDPKNFGAPIHLHQQEIIEGRIQHLATDPSGWNSGVPWYLTTIHRIKMMADGVARIIPFLANSGAPTPIGINRPGSLGSTGNAADAGHEHATPGIASPTADGFMSSASFNALSEAYSHSLATGNPHNTQIGDIPNLSSVLSNKADLVGGLIPLSQIPGSLEDLIEYPTRNDFPETGRPGVIYLALDKNHQWRWTGSQYIDMTSEGGDQYNSGVTLEGPDAFSSRGSFDGRGGVRSGNGSGPFGHAYYNIVDVRHRNAWGAPDDIWGGELAWGMTQHQHRLAFRSRGPDGTPGGWTEVSTVGHGHAIPDVAGLQGALDGKLTRIADLIVNGNANSAVYGGVWAGYNVANTPNSGWGVLRVYRAPGDAGDVIWQVWSCNGYSDGGRVYRRWSFDFGVTWTAWQTDKDIFALGMLENITWEPRANQSWIKVCDITIHGQFESAVMSALFTSQGGAGFAGDSGVTIATFRIKQQNPMTSPMHIIDIDVSTLTGRAIPHKFGYVITTDTASVKVVTIYARRPYTYSGTLGTVIARHGGITTHNTVTETEPPGIIYVSRSEGSPVQKRVFSIGDGSATSFSLHHGLDTTAVRVTVRKKTSPFAMWECLDELDPADPANKVLVGFSGYTPAPNEFEVTVFG